MARVVIEHLSKVFPGGRGAGIRAVEDVSFNVDDRELLVLVGPSGSGKTTILRLLAGLEEPTAGTLSIDGRVVNGVAPKERDVAMVFQSPALYPHMSVYQNMAFGLKLRKQPRAEIGQRVREAAELLGLEDCLERKPHELSGGQRQRVAVGRAIVRRPKVFLFDEPLSNLDAPMRVQLRAEIARLHTRLAATMIYVTHDQVEAMTLGDRIAVLQSGVLQQVDEPLRVYQQPANLFVAGFIGSPPMNLFRGTLMRSGSGLAFQALSASHIPQPTRFAVRLTGETVGRVIAYVGKPIILGIRPEHVTGCLHPDGAQPEQTVEATVEVVEPLGSETHLYLAGGGCAFSARVPAMERVSVGQKVVASFQMEQARFFDPATEKRIG